MQSVIDVVKGPKGWQAETSRSSNAEDQDFSGEGGLRTAFSFCAGLEPAHGTFRISYDE
jgi:hypothetical protein